MTTKAESNLFPRILIAILVVTGSITLHRIIYDIMQGETVSLFQKMLAGSIILVLLMTLAYVIVQRIEMRKTEKFRREKW